MNTNNDITGDRITNALKGDKEKYREGWEAIFGKKTGEDFYCYSCYDEGEIPSQDESGYFICPDCNDTGY